MMAYNFCGKVVVITGSATGIGAAAALMFAELGAHLVLVDQVKDPARGLTPMPADVLTHTVDLRDPHATEQCVRQIAETVPVVDVLVNNAGALVVESIANTSLDLWNSTNHLHVTAPFLFIRGLLESMARSGAASIINHASIDGLFGHPMMPVYGSSKGALVSVTRNFAMELGRKGIRINCLASGGIETPLVDSVNEEGRKLTARLAPLQRLGKAEEVASVIVFLASPQASYMSGSVLTIDGGRTAVTPGTTHMDPLANMR